ncbi:hypothetical protein KBD87_00755 [Candidatus Saccharibacteria bacterium]|jgi:mannose-6-phosphate isomerase-like protein (cupin superfamily)|nr:hypothetical protein [Candidatus Saccharibacteria bacterium]
MVEKKSKDVERFESVVLEPTSRLQTAVWWVRRSLRNILDGKDVLDVHSSDARLGKKLHRVYKKADGAMKRYFPGVTKAPSKKVATRRVRDAIDDLGYTITDMDESKPWGAYYTMKSSDADRFIVEFFPGLSAIEARLGRSELELSPKFLLVSPGQRLSWQLHERRAERWRFLNHGAYYKSVTDEPGDKIIAKSGHVVQFAKGERHRLCAASKDSYTLVAEIWQHVDSKHPSNEADIIRIHDDYAR